MDKTLYIPIDTTINNTVECPELVKRGDTILLNIKVFTKAVLTDLTGQSIDIILKKADGTKIERAIDTSNIANGIITVKPGQQSTLVEGKVNGELQIYTNDTLSSTNTFTYTVDASLADDILIASQDDIQVLADLRNLIASGEVTIQKYEDIVLAIGNSVEAVEALANIKSYIDTNLPNLENANAQAVVNISDETAQNTQATQNISDLESANATALNTKNALDTSNTTALATKNALDTSNTNANATKVDLDTSNTNATNTKTALDSSNSTATATKNALDASNSQAVTNKSLLDTANTRAENNIQALNSFGDATTLTQDVTAVKTEVENARGTYANLKARLDASDTSLSKSVQKVDDASKNVDAMAIYNATCAYASNVFTLTLANAPTTLPDMYTVRFKATNPWVDGSVVKIGTKTYSVVNAGFVQDEVVIINVDEVAAKCFFKSGGSSILDTLPAQVSTFTAIAGNKSLTFNWNISDSSNLSGFFLVYKQGSSPANVNDGIKIDITNPATTSQQVTGVTNDLSYIGRIFPYNSKKQAQTQYKVATATPVDSMLINTLAINSKVLVKNDVYMIYQNNATYIGLISCTSLGNVQYRNVYNDMAYPNTQLKAFIDSYAATNYASAGLVAVSVATNWGSYNLSIRPPLKTEIGYGQYSGGLYWTLTPHETVNNYMYDGSASSDDVTKYHEVRTIINIDPNKLVRTLPNASGQYILL